MRDQVSLTGSVLRESGPGELRVGTATCAAAQLMPPHDTASGTRALAWLQRSLEGKGKGAGYFDARPSLWDGEAEDANQGIDLVHPRKNDSVQRLGNAVSWS